MAESNPPPADSLKAGFLTKQGAGFRRKWKNKWCVLKEDTLSYYNKQTDSKPKNTIDLKKGRGARTKEHCSFEDWPGDATYCFALATSERTWYFYGSDESDVKEWRELVQQCIEKVGKPTSDWKNDVEGKPEGAVSKALRSGAKQAASHAKDNVPSTGNKYADGALKTGLSVAESQADADPNTSMKDRLKMAGGDVVTGVADTVDNPVVSVAANVAKDQLEADEDLSLKQRLALAGGSAVEGVGDVTGVDAVNIAGGVIKDQATADEDASMKERLAIGVGSVAGGIKDSSNDPLVQTAAKVVEKTAGEAADQLGKSSSQGN